ncbi:MAG: nucleotidyltransferase domain-containing protein [Nitrososphaeria archaeon]|nr:nucleotidyltransferase domain-containing protein [Nitrososphaeria archaeon]
MNDIKSTYLKLVKEYMDEIKEALNGKLVSVCLFGSIARGDFTRESDIDLLIIAKNVPDDVGRRHSLFRESRRKILSSDTAVNLRRMGYSTTFSEIILTPEEVKTHPPILLDIVEEGIILYDDNNFLSSIIDEVRCRLKKLGAKRIKLKRGWYWLLKPDAKFGEEIIV